jgi:glycosyltransferase involved in cell wall biosynthesis
MQSNTPRTTITTMKLSFVIPAYNEEHYVGECLDSIIAQKKALPQYDIEIIVVNNASTDGTADVVKKYASAAAGGVRLVDERAKGLVRARRAGFLASSGNLIANVDSDSRLTPGWIEKVMTAFANDSKLVAFSGPFIYYDAPRSVRISTRIFYYLGYISYLFNRFILRSGSMLQGGNFVVRRDALQKIGGYDTNISFYGEDTDIARRMTAVGHVTFTFDLPMYSSGRRLAKEGGLTIGLRYALNYFWELIFKKPFSADYTDVRLTNKNEVVYNPENKKKEWMIGTGLILILIIIIVAIYFIYKG